MAIVSLEEKRLKQLKQQLFGKSDSAFAKITPRQVREAGPKVTVSAAVFESVNLKSDLFRIALLSFAALAIQLSIFFAIQKGFLKLF